MLRFLSIRQLAVIDALEVELGPGLTVLTGETGAGKSILVEAVDLLLGGRASADLVRTGADAAHVQAVVETATGEELIVRREVSAAGRSRAFVNGDLVTSAQLREVTGPLIDLHGQHAHQSLLAPEHHLDLLDRFAGLDARRAEVVAAFDRYQQIRQALEACELDERERVARHDLFSFQLAEIDKVHPVPGEDDALAAERQRLVGRDRIQKLAGEAYLLLYEGDRTILGDLAIVWKRVADLSELDGALAPCLEARDPIRSQLEDLAFALRSLLASLDGSPDRLQQVEDRLALLERLKRRHGPTVEAVLGKRVALAAELSALETATARAASLAGELDLARADFLAAARRLSADRRSAAIPLAAGIATALQALAMPRTRLEVRFQEGEPPEARWRRTGIDDVELFFSANPGEAPRALARIASGGELSRVMLAIKTLATTDLAGKTLIFDEVDAGIGGHVADAVGERLRALGGAFQVLCITHLPQVAAHGHTHFRVRKEIRAGRTETHVDRLAADSRVEELARMIGGASITASVQAGAREMLHTRNPGETTSKGESERAKAKVVVLREAGQTRGGITET
jgi:DNA repair protein RecN (Recombination protein N)